MKGRLPMLPKPFFVCRFEGEEQGIEFSCVLVGLDGRLRLQYTETGTHDVELAIGSSDSFSVTQGSGPGKLSAYLALLLAIRFHFYRN